MNFIPTPLAGCYILEPKVILDERGYFMESFNEQTFQKATGQAVHFVQDNQSYSSKGVLRGLHYQVGEHAQAKLVRVLSGAVLDVAVDIRPDSPTYGQHFSTELTAENQRQSFIPRGFAHGFLVLSETATFFINATIFITKHPREALPTMIWLWLLIGKCSLICFVFQKKIKFNRCWQTPDPYGSFSHWRKRPIGPSPAKHCAGISSNSVSVLRFARSGSY
jgi:dTDP-4-dehydrorhamnose 3,5-epimerase